MLSDATTERLAGFADKFRYTRLSRAEVRHAKFRIIDSLACAVAAHDAPPSKIARQVAPRIARAERGARVFGSLARTTIDGAAFANAMMVRYLDFNDAYRNVDGCHPSDTLPALLAVCEAYGLTGRELIAALAVSYEIQLAFADSVALDKLGWDHAIPEVIASAVGAAKLMRLTKSETCNAIALAVTPNMATHQRHIGELSMWKSGYAAMSARQGVYAALLAQHGMTGPQQPIEGQHGLRAQAGWKGSELVPLAPAGRPLAIARTSVKRWPVRDSCQLPIDTALELRKETGKAPINAIEVRIYKSACQDRRIEPEFWAPDTRETADHSMPFLVAATLLDGSISMKTFERARHRDRDVRALMQRVELKADPAFTAAAPRVRNCSISARLRDGTVRYAQLTRPSDPRAAVALSESEIEEKFFRLTDGLMPQRQRASLIAKLWSLERIANAADVVGLLRIPGC